MNAIHPNELKPGVKFRFIPWGTECPANNVWVDRDHTIIDIGLVTQKVRNEEFVYVNAELSGGTIVGGSISAPTAGRIEQDKT